MPPSVHPPVLSLTGVSKRYRAGVPGCQASVRALDDVSLEVRAGECATIAAGPRSGKTTLLLCAAGMLRPDRGSVEWPALGARGERPESGIGYVTARVPAYNFLTVRESLSYAVAVRATARDAPVADIEAIIGTTGLLELTDTRLGLLSPDGRLHLLVALALVANPALLLVDDVGSDAGAGAQRAFAAMLERVAALGVAVIWAARGIPDSRCRYLLDAGRLRTMEHGPAGRNSAQSLTPAVLPGTLSRSLPRPPLAQLRETPSPQDET